VYTLILGTIIGDTIGLPLDSDNHTFQIIDSQRRSKDFLGVYSKFDYQAGTFSPSTSMGLVLLTHYATRKRFIKSLFVTDLLEWYSKYSSTVVDPNVKELFSTGSPTKNAHPGSLTRYLGIVCKHSDCLPTTIQQTLEIVGMFEGNKETIGAVLFVNCLVWCLLFSSCSLKESVIETIGRCQGHLPKSILERVPNFHTLKYTNLSKSGSITECIINSLWCVYNTKNYSDAVTKAVNIKGNTTAVCSLTAALSSAIHSYTSVPQDWITTFDLKNRDNSINGSDQIKSDSIRSLVDKV